MTADQAREFKALTDTLSEKDSNIELNDIINNIKIKVCTKYSPNNISFVLDKISNIVSIRKELELLGYEVVIDRSGNTDYLTVKW